MRKSTLQEVIINQSQSVQQSLNQINKKSHSTARCICAINFLHRKSPVHVSQNARLMCCFTRMNALMCRLIPKHVKVPSTWLISIVSDQSTWEPPLFWTPTSMMMMMVMVVMICTHNTCDHRGRYQTCSATSFPLLSSVRLSQYITQQKRVPPTD